MVYFPCDDIQSAHNNKSNQGSGGNLPLQVGFHHTLEPYFLEKLWLDVT